MKKKIFAFARKSLYKTLCLSLGPVLLWAETPQSYAEKITVTVKQSVTVAVTNHATSAVGSTTNVEVIVERAEGSLTNAAPSSALANWRPIGMAPLEKDPDMTLEFKGKGSSDDPLTIKATLHLSEGSTQADIDDAVRTAYGQILAANPQFTVAVCLTIIFIVVVGYILYKIIQFCEKNLGTNAPPTNWIPTNPPADQVGMFVLENEGSPQLVMSKANVASDNVASAGTNIIIDVGVPVAIILSNGAPFVRMNPVQFLHASDQANTVPYSNWYPAIGIDFGSGGIPVAGQAYFAHRGVPVASSNGVPLDSSMTISFNTATGVPTVKPTNSVGATMPVSFVVQQGVAISGATNWSAVPNSTINQVIRSDDWTTNMFDTSSMPQAPQLFYRVLLTY